MEDAEFRRLLRQAVHLPDDASDYAILAEVETGYHFYLLNRPAPGDGANEAIRASLASYEKIRRLRGDAE